MLFLACMWLHLFGLVYDLWLHSIILTVPLADHLFFQSVELARKQVLWQLYFSCHCRHAGDLGNIEADSEGQAEVTITDYVVSLMGEYSVIGRTLEVCKHHWFLAKWELKARTWASTVSNESMGKQNCDKLGPFFLFQIIFAALIIHEPFKLIIEELLKSILVCYKTHNKLAQW